MFSPAVFDFLSELSDNNHREWFELNKARYEELVREPARALIRGFAPYLAEMAPQFVASDKKVGGSLMRVQRDVRFSANKSPYKTNIGLHFRHSAGADVHAPGLYCHLALDGCFVGAGCWRPEAGALASIRQHLAQHHRQWQKLLLEPDFSARYALSGESLSRAPKGFDPQHPALEHLKRKDFIAIAPIEPELLYGPDAPQRLAELYRPSLPLVDFLCRALQVSL